MYFNASFVLIEGILLYSSNYFVHCIVVETTETAADNTEPEKAPVKPPRKKPGIYK